MELHAPPVSYDRIVMASCQPGPPPVERGCHRFDYTLCGVDLVCDVWFDAGERGSWSCGQQMEPDVPDNAHLQHAFVRDVNVTKILSDEQREQIEEAFLESGAY